MERITYKQMKEIVKNFNNRNIRIQVNGIIAQIFDIKDLKIYFKQDMIIITDDNIEKLKINSCWIANFYTNKDNTIMRYEFDQTGAVELYII